MSNRQFDNFTTRNNKLIGGKSKDARMDERHKSVDFEQVSRLDHNFCLSALLKTKHRQHTAKSDVIVEKCLKRLCISFQRLRKKINHEMTNVNIGTTIVTCLVQKAIVIQPDSSRQCIFDKIQMKCWQRICVYI